MGVSEDSRLEQICSEFVVKSVHIITASRTPKPIEEAGRQFGTKRQVGKASQPSPEWVSVGRSGRGRVGSVGRSWTMMMMMMIMITMITIMIVTVDLSYVFLFGLYL